MKREVINVKFFHLNITSAITLAKYGMRKDFLKVPYGRVVNVGRFLPFHVIGNFPSQPLPKCVKLNCPVSLFENLLGGARSCRELQQVPYFILVILKLLVKQPKGGCSETSPSSYSILILKGTHKFKCETLVCWMLKSQKMTSTNLVEHPINIIKPIQSSKTRFVSIPGKCYTPLSKLFNHIISLILELYSHVVNNLSSPWRHDDFQFWWLEVIIFKF